MSALTQFRHDPSAIFELSRQLRGHPDLAPVLATLKAEIGRLATQPPALSQFDAMLCAPDAAETLNFLREIQALNLLLPEVDALHNFHLSSPRPHKDLWEHSLEVLARTPPEPDLRWVALCHDIGKVATRSLDTKGQLIFHRHEATSAFLFRGLAARLGMPLERIDSIAFIITHHARIHAFEESWTDRALRRLVRDAGPYLDAMIAFADADWTTKNSRRQAKIRRNMAAFRQRLTDLERPDPQPLPEGISQALLRLAGRAPGPWLGQAWQWIDAHAARLTETPAEEIAQQALDALTEPPGDAPAAPLTETPAEEIAQQALDALTEPPGDAHAARLTETPAEEIAQQAPPPAPNGGPSL